MSSAQDRSLAKISEAIDEVAAALAADNASVADPGELATRLAGIWAMLAELDPARAMRAARYASGQDKD